MYKRTARRGVNYNYIISRLFTLVVILTIVIAITFMAVGFISRAESDGGDVEISYKYYTSIEIQKGDTVWDLSAEYADSHYESREAYIEEVIQINSLEDADDIVAGQYIIMPYYSTEIL